MTKLATGRHTQKIKSHAKSKKQYLKNKALKTRAKTFIKKVTEALEEKQIEKAVELMPSAEKIIDMAASKGAIHKKKASRLKSRLALKVNKTKAEQ